MSVSLSPRRALHINSVSLNGHNLEKPTVLTKEFEEMDLGGSKENEAPRTAGRYFLPSEDKINQVALKKFKEEKIKQGTEELQKQGISLKDREAVTQFFKYELSPILDQALNSTFGEKNPHILANRGGIKAGIYYSIKHPKS